MPSFQAPSNPNGVPSILPDTRGAQRKLFRHYRPRPEGINVYVLSDGSVTESDPNGSSILWREADRSPETEEDAVTVVHVFWGGHEAETITDAMAAILIGAGYTVDDVEPPPEEPPPEPDPGDLLLISGTDVLLISGTDRLLIA